MAYSHQLVALVERWHRTLKQLLAAERVAEKEVKWYECLPLLELAFNAAVNATTGIAPFFVENMRDAVLPVEVMNKTYTKAQVAEEQKLPDWVQDRLEQMRITYDAAAKALYLNSLHAQRSGLI